MESDPANDAKGFEEGQKSWYETKVLVGAEGSIYTVSGTGVSPGTRTTGQRVGGKAERIGRETSSLYPSESFLTADGTLWNAFFGELSRFSKGRWETVARIAGGAKPVQPQARERKRSALVLARSIPAPPLAARPRAGEGKSAACPGCLE